LRTDDDKTVVAFTVPGAFKKKRDLIFEMGLEFVVHRNGCKLVENELRRVYQKLYP
jgi:hypothetical protein